MKNRQLKKNNLLNKSYGAIGTVSARKQKIRQIKAESISKISEFCIEN